jgi:hypothetical protein
MVTFILSTMSFGFHLRVAVILSILTFEFIFIFKAWFRMSLFNIFNPPGLLFSRHGDLLKDLIKLVIKNSIKLILGNTVIEICRRILIFAAAVP